MGTVYGGYGYRYRDDCDFDEECNEVDEWFGWALIGGLLLIFCCCAFASLIKKCNKERVSDETKHWKDKQKKIQQAEMSVNPPLDAISKTNPHNETARPMVFGGPQPQVFGGP